MKKFRIPARQKARRTQKRRWRFLEHWVTLFVAIVVISILVLPSLIRSALQTSYTPASQTRQTGLAAVAAPLQPLLTQNGQQAQQRLADPCGDKEGDKFTSCMEDVLKKC